MATKDLTVGTPFKVIVSFMLPIFLGTLFQQLYHFADSLIVGRILGVDALAAVGATIPLLFLVISFIFAATQGFTVITAQRFGAGDYENVRKSLCASLILSGILMVIITLISTPFSKQLLELLRTPANIFDDAFVYVFILFAGIFATVFYNVSANILRAVGDSKTPLYFLIFTSVINIILDIIFIADFKMGVAGAAWATVIAEAVSTILCMSFMFWKFPILRVSKKDWIISKEFYLEHIKTGIPMGFQMSVMGLGIIILQFVLNSFGSKAIAAYTTGMRIDQLFSQAYLALGATMAVYTAQNYGANKMTRIRAGVKTSVQILLLITMVSIVSIFVFGKQMVILFMNEVDAEVVHLAQIYLIITICFFVFLGILLVFRNILQGMGKVWVPLISGLTELIARGVCAVVFGKLFGYIGLCIASPAAWLGASIVLFAGYKLSLVKHLKFLRGKTFLDRQ